MGGTIKSVTVNFRAIKKKHVTIGIFLGILIGVSAFILVQPKEPEYQGKKLSEWLSMDDSTSGISSVGTVSGKSLNDEAILAVKMIGKPAIPFLMRMITKRYRSNEVILFLKPYCSRFIKIDVTEPCTLRDRAVLGFLALGMDAESATEDLEELRNESNQDIRYAAVKALNSIRNPSYYIP